jgi:gluconolactonase
MVGAALPAGQGAREPEAVSEPAASVPGEEFEELATGLRFPEGPVWCADGSVLVVEMALGRISRVRTDTGAVEVVAEPGGSPNGLAIGPDGALYVCNSGGWRYHDLGGMLVPDPLVPEGHPGGRIERVDLATGEVRVLYERCGDHPLRRPNDLVFDADGGMWFTDHGRTLERSRDLGAVYWARPDGSEIREVIFGLETPNGIGLSPGGDRLYVAETNTARVWWWPVVGPGEVETPGMIGGRGALLAGVGGLQLFDSLAVDTDGHVVVATIVAGGLTDIPPDGGPVTHVPLPDPVVTNVCFGGPDRRDAYVTLSASGRLVRLRWPRPGLELAYGC